MKDRKMILLEKIYDTLMLNTQYPQFKGENTKDQFIDYIDESIWFDFGGGHNIKLKIVRN